MYILRVKLYHTCNLSLSLSLYLSLSLSLYIYIYIEREREERPAVRRPRLRQELSMPALNPTTSTTTSKMI